MRVTHGFCGSCSAEVHVNEDGVLVDLISESPTCTIGGDDPHILPEED